MEAKHEKAGKRGWADSHAHLNHPNFDGDISEVAEKLAEERFQVLNVAFDLPSAERGIELARTYPHMKASAGVHPHDAESVSDDALSRIRGMAEDENVVAIGETGLDYFRNRSPKEAQKKILVEHLKISRDSGKPVIIHCRDAFDDILPIFRENFDPDIGGVLHCFSEGADEARRGLELGFYISFAGNVTYKTAGRLREAAKVVPAEKLLIETDCPYLAPQPMRGKRNEPLFIQETAKLLAEVRGVTVEDIARGTAANYRALFLKEEPEQAEIIYWIRKSLYINVTRNCSNLCTFCSRVDSPFVQGHYLGVERDPTAEEILSAIGDARPDELVFCGFGEPTMRMKVIKKVAASAKQRGLKVRLNTNGHGSLINGRDIVPELEGLVDVISVSLNAPDKESYNRICRPADPENGFPAMLDFIKRCRDVFEVQATAVDLPEGVDIPATEKLAERLGVKFRLRAYDMVG